MRPPVRRAAASSAALAAAGLLQAAFGNWMHRGRAQPDLLTATAIIIASFGDANSGAAVGFAAGLISASLSAPPTGFGSIVVSRTLVGFGTGWLESRLFRDSAIVAVGLVVCGTALAEVLFFLFSPQRQTLTWAYGTLGVTIYNGCFALPIYVLLRRFLRTPAA